MKTKAITLFLAAFCAGASLAVQAETIEGVLEKSTPYSALFSASLESGDLIGYPFKNQSAVGKTILSNCLPGLRCKIGKAATRNMENTAALKFADRQAGWKSFKPKTPAWKPLCLATTKSQNPLRRGQRARRGQLAAVQGQARFTRY